jgi:hypothetical protein
MSLNVPKNSLPLLSPISEGEENSLPIFVQSNAVISISIHPLLLIWFANSVINLFKEFQVKQGPGIIFVLNPVRENTIANYAQENTFVKSAKYQ